MNRIRRIAWVAGSALVTLLVAAAAPLGLGRGGTAAAQYAQPAPRASTPGSQPAAAPPASAPAPAQGAAQAPGQPAAPAQAAAPGPGAPGAAPKLKLPQIQGDYDIDELRRLIDLARESGFSDQQIRDITVEDAQGHVINAWEFLQAYDRRQQEAAARLAAEQSKVYLAPKDILRELDKKQPKDLDQLRDRMLFVD